MAMSRHRYREEIPSAFPVGFVCLEVDPFEKNDGLRQSFFDLVILNTLATKWEEKQGHAIPLV